MAEKQLESSKKVAEKSRKVAEKSGKVTEKVFQVPSGHVNLLMDIYVIFLNFQTSVCFPTQVSWRVKTHYSDSSTTSDIGQEIQMEQPLCSRPTLVVTLPSCKMLWLAMFLELKLHKYCQAVQHSLFYTRLWYLQLFQFGVNMKGTEEDHHSTNQLDNCVCRAALASVSVCQILLLAWETRQHSG